MQRNSEVANNARLMALLEDRDRAFQQDSGSVREELYMCVHRCIETARDRADLFCCSLGDRMSQRCLDAEHRATAAESSVESRT
jgi:hypothetical protein